MFLELGFGLLKFYFIIENKKYLFFIVFVIFNMFLDG